MLWQLWNHYERIREMVWGERMLKGPVGQEEYNVVAFADVTF